MGCDQQSFSSTEPLTSLTPTHSSQQLALDPCSCSTGTRGIESEIMQRDVKKVFSNTGQTGAIRSRDQPDKCTDWIHFMCNQTPLYPSPSTSFCCCQLPLPLHIASSVGTVPLTSFQYSRPSDLHPYQLQSPGLSAVSL